MIVKINFDHIEINRKIQGLCKLPYHGHAKGCHNYGLKEGCPPGQPLLGEIFDLERNLFVIYTQHNIGEFASRMREKHPEWNDRQCYNPRYWQGTARKTHMAEREKALKLDGIEKIVWPENHGVNVSKLMSGIGVDLNWNWPPPHNLENSSYIISLGGK
jgi:hypothetical protein